MDKYQDDALLDDPETTKYLNLKPGTLAVWRCEKRYDLPFIKVGASVRYRFSDIKEWLRKREVNSSSSSAGVLHEPTK